MAAHLFPYQFLQPEGKNAHCSLSITKIPLKIKLKLINKFNHSINKWICPKAFSLLPMDIAPISWTLVSGRNMILDSSPHLKKMKHLDFLHNIQDLFELQYIVYGFYIV